ncbi:MAG: FGGY-family carbohydrate kinase [Deltaproteobacteria bacterium]|nr:FGGY-family carbohydrate kinase [Deltaproteobacteria bacterium]
MEKPILSIDCGTQRLRVLLFSEKGELLDRTQIKYEPYYSERPGWAEKNPDVYWQSLCDGCRELKERNSQLFENIAGVGVTTQRATMINLDSKGDVLRPAIIWLDQRSAEPNYKPYPPMKMIYKIVGMDEAIEKTQRDGKCNWIMQNQPEIWAATHKYLQVSGFINFRLTGEFKDSIASQIGHIPFNYKKMEWGKGRQLPNLFFPVEKEKLPDLVGPGEQLGKISKGACLETGIPEGTPVIACGSDKGCETIGMGVVDQTMASLSFGTTATVQTTTAKYFETLAFLPPYPAPIPGHYNPEVEILRGYWMITWFKNEFAHKEVQEAESKGVAPEEMLNNLLKQSPPGSMGLVVQPYWSPGLKEPSAKGAMIGFGDVHTRAHVYRAVIEGLAFGLLEGLHKMEKKGKQKVNKLAVSGGASQSDEICQISADIFNLPLVRGKTWETSGLGAAIVTAAGLGVYPSVGAAIKNMVGYKKIFEPDRKNAKIYQELFERVYKNIYKALCPLYKEIRDITGYPEK